MEVGYVHKTAMYQTHLQLEQTNLPVLERWCENNLKMEYLEYHHFLKHFLPCLQRKVAKNGQLFISACLPSCNNSRTGDKNLLTNSSLVKSDNKNGLFVWRPTWVSALMCSVNRSEISRTKRRGIKVKHILFPVQFSLSFVVFEIIKKGTFMQSLTQETLDWFWSSFILLDPGNRLYLSYAIYKTASDVNIRERKSRGKNSVNASELLHCAYTS